MILVDASIWIDHIRSPLSVLSDLLAADMVLGHSMVTGEVALGSMANRAKIIQNLQDLPAATEAEHDEVMGFITTHGVFGTGIGYVDVHLLASCLLTSSSTLWSRDKSLRRAAVNMNLAFMPPD